MKVGTSVVGMPEADGAVLRQRLIGLAVFSAVLVICFARPLYGLARFAFGSSLYSHILLIPFITAYLIWQKRRELGGGANPARGVALVLLGTGSAIVCSYWLASRAGWKPAPEDYLALMTLSFLAFLVSAGCLFLGREAMTRIAFPASFLVFMAPFPVVVQEWLEAFLRQCSADVAHALLTLTGIPVLQRGTELKLPGFSMDVAPECSGIHSSLVLFITSVLAAHLLLRTGWSRAALAAAVIPLGILRNGVRICVLAHLCVRDPSWIDSSLHHRGGPVFFVGSLIPLFLLLVVLRRWEGSRSSAEGAVGGDPSSVGSG